MRPSAGPLPTTRKNLLPPWHPVPAPAPVDPSGYRLDTRARDHLSSGSEPSSLQGRGLKAPRVVVVRFRGCCPTGDDAVRIIKRQGPQQDGIDNGEKMTLFVPMPSASAMSAAAVKADFCANCSYSGGPGLWFIIKAFLPIVRRGDQYMRGCRLEFVLALPVREQREAYVPEVVLTRLRQKIAL
jgi:hypothetical protein